MVYYATSIDTQDPNPLWHDAYSSYLDLEYYRGELKGFNKLLKPLSRFYKGEISVELLVNAFMLIHTQERGDSAGWFKQWYTDTGLKLAGLIDEETESAQ